MDGEWTVNGRSMDGQWPVNGRSRADEWTFRVFQHKMRLGYILDDFHACCMILFGLCVDFVIFHTVEPVEVAISLLRLIFPAKSKTDRLRLRDC